MSSRKCFLCSLAKWARKKSVWLYHAPAGGLCNGCDIEIAAAITPRYDVERFGILLAPSPRHADILLIAGQMTKHSRERLLRVYQQVPEPKAVVAIGSCAISGNVFTTDNYPVAGTIDQVIPVDVYVPGCPPKPEAIILGVVKAIEKLEKRTPESI